MDRETGPQLKKVSDEERQRLYAEISRMVTEEGPLYLNFGMPMSEALRAIHATLEKLRAERDALKAGRNLGGLKVRA